MDLTVLAHGHAAFGHEAQHFGIQDVLDLVDAGFEVVEGIVLAHLHGALRHDGAFVVVLVREVDGDARHFHARVERVLDGSNVIGGTACFVTMLLTIWPKLREGSYCSQ